MTRRKRQMGKMVMTAILAAALLAGNTTGGYVYAANEFSVTSTKAVLYSVGDTPVYAAPDLTGTIVTTLAANIPVSVLGVTSNGWFQVDINGVYYIPGSGLKASTDGSGIVSYDEEGIKKLTKGTFSFYSNSELRKIDKDDIKKMDDNEYIKYLDSFLIGNAMADYCIISDSMLMLKTHYETLSKTDDTVAAMSMKDYLVSYRNQYLQDSIYGPVRTEKALLQVLTRAIRYDKNNFKTIYKSAVIGSDEEQMEDVLEKVTAQIKDEQGITFSYKKTYGTYQTKEGKNASGWILEFSQKN